jgi:hypothetical protein
VKVSDILVTVHQRDSGNPTSLNPLTLGCAYELPKYPARPLGPGLDDKGGTAIWVLGRQEPFYIRETLEQLGALEFNLLQP